MEITITRALNGALVKSDHNNPNTPYESADYHPPVSMVFEFDEEDDTGLDGLILMFYHIMDELGICTGKYSKERVSISLIHGSDYECTDKECKICAEGKNG